MQLIRLVSALTAVSVLAVPVLAQGQNGNDDNNSPTPDNSPNPASPDPAASVASGASADNSASKVPAANSDSKASPSPSPSKNDSPSDSPTPTPKNTSPSSSQSKASPTPTPLPTPSSPIPSLTTPKAAASPSNPIDVPTGLPTLTGQFAIPTYPPASVPPTKNAPFMQQSSAPSGTVFIAVGAILGAFAIGLLIWRTTVSFLLHRSVDRAAMAQHDANSKAGFPIPPAPFYKDTDGNSPGGMTRSARRSSRGPGIPSASQSASNLFFSPTAAGSGAGQRGSAFLPSGFYNAGTSTPGGHGPSISLTNLRPESMAHNNASRITLDRTPPDSPHGQVRRDMSSTSLSLASRQPGQRAPSAYLEGLLADDPSCLPPPQMPSQNSPGNRGSGRF